MWALPALSCSFPPTWGCSDPRAAWGAGACQPWSTTGPNFRGGPSWPILLLYQLSLAPNDDRGYFILNKISDFHSHVCLCCSVSQSCSGRLRKAPHIYFFQAFTQHVGAGLKIMWHLSLSFLPSSRSRQRDVQGKQQMELQLQQPTELIPLI